jgi:riboflavin kinase/FMN adenylyltransferase
VELLGRYGAAAVVLLPFDRALANLAPEAFLEKHLFTDAVEVRSICVGRDWRFGHRGRGDVDLLAEQAAERGTNVTSMPPFTLYGKPVSSTRTREAVAAGKLELARRLLGRPYAVAGTVVHGKGIGRKACHCATANVDASGMVLPPPGVYAVVAHLENSPHRSHPAIAYIGSAPTIRTDPDIADAQRCWVETHLLDHDANLYGQRVEVQFVAFLRGDRVFPSVAELREQIDRDILAARALAGRPSANDGGPGR